MDAETPNRSRDWGLWMLLMGATIGGSQLAVDHEEPLLPTGRPPLWLAVPAPAPAVPRIVFPALEDPPDWDGNEK